jgi:nucleoid-associated protein YgaU
MAFFLTLALAVPAAWAQQPDPRRDGNVVQLQPDAPDSYVVQKGDTLWGISAKFLREPWRWPEIWRLNKDQIRNPHLIYPGEIVRLDRATGTLSLDRLEPRVRAERLATEAIPTIPLKVVEPFLSRPLIIERNGLENAPQIVATEEGRYNVGAGSRAYVSGIQDSKETLWQIYRPGRILTDPEDNKVLAYEAIYLGTARLEKRGEPSTVRILAGVQEISVGDRLVVAPVPQVFAFAPRAPEKPVNGRVIALYREGITDARDEYYAAGGFPAFQMQPELKLGETGGLSIISLNKGARDGLEPGHILALSRDQLVIRDNSVGPFLMGKPRPPNVQLPEERIGLVMVFRVFDTVSYALTLGVQRPVSRGDVISKP